MKAGTGVVDEEKEEQERPCLFVNDIFFDVYYTFEDCRGVESSKFIVQ